MSYFHIPFNGQQPDPAVADRFLTTITRGNEPAYIHCARRQPRGRDVDDQAARRRQWETESAATEATALGLTSPALKKFAIDYADRTRDSLRWTT